MPLGCDGHLNQHDWRFFGITDQILRLTFPSGRMTLAVHITERLTALLPKLYLYLLSAMAGPCAHEDDEREVGFATLAHSELPDERCETSPHYAVSICNHISYVVSIT